MLLFLGSHKIKSLDVMEKVLRVGCNEDMARNGSVYIGCGRT
jgi:hypothetical protein